MIEIELSNQQDAYPADEPRLVEAARRILRDEGIRDAVVSIAIVDDATIHELNRRYLQHDYATDVLSFVLQRENTRLEGEVIISADTAEANGVRFGWSRDDELLLYVVHGTLHLVGYDDRSAEDQCLMRERERHYLGCFGLDARYDDASGERPVEPEGDRPLRDVEDAP